MEGEWTFNTPNTDYWRHGTYDTKEEAEKAAIEYAKRNGYVRMAIGRTEPIPLPTYVYPNRIMEELHEYYADEAGMEYDRDLYEDIEEDGWEWLEKEMSKVIEKFHEKFKVTSNWFKVTNVYTIEIGGAE